MSQRALLNLCEAMHRGPGQLSIQPKGFPIGQVVWAHDQLESCDSTRQLQHMLKTINHSPTCRVTGSAYQDHLVFVHFQTSTVVISNFFECKATNRGLNIVSYGCSTMLKQQRIRNMFIISLCFSLASIGISFTSTPSGLPQCRRIFATLLHPAFQFDNLKPPQ